MACRSSSFQGLDAQVSAQPRSHSTNARVSRKRQKLGISSFPTVLEYPASRRTRAPDPDKSTRARSRRTVTSPNPATGRQGAAIPPLQFAPARPDRAPPAGSAPAPARPGPASAMLHPAGPSRALGRCGWDFRSSSAPAPARSSRGRGDDVTGGAVVVGEVDRPRPVIRLETADELYRRAIEGINVLIVVADREQGELGVFFLQRAPSSYWSAPMSWYSSTRIQRNPASSRSRRSSASSGGRPSPCNSSTARRITSRNTSSSRRSACPAKLAPASRMASAWQVSTVTPAHRVQ